jgi:uncharacterized protein DUF1360
LLWRRLLMAPAYFFYAAMACGYVTYLVTASHLSHGVRMWLHDRSKFIGMGASCPFCVSFWVALGLESMGPQEFGLVFAVMTLALAMSAAFVAVALKFLTGLTLR